MKLFDYIHEPTISMNPYEEKVDNEQGLWTILKTEKTTLQSAFEALLAYE